MPATVSAHASSGPGARGPRRSGSGRGPRPRRGRRPAPTTRVNASSPSRCTPIAAWTWPLASSSSASRRPARGEPGDVVAQQAVEEADAASGPSTQISATRLGDPAGAPSAQPRVAGGDVRRRPPAGSRGRDLPVGGRALARPGGRASSPGRPARAARPPSPGARLRRAPPAAPASARRAARSGSRRRRTGRRPPAARAAASPSRPASGRYRASTRVHQLSGAGSPGSSASALDLGREVEPALGLLDHPRPAPRPPRPRSGGRPRSAAPASRSGRSSRRRRCPVGPAWRITKGRSSSTQSA